MTPGSANSVAIEGDYAFVADYNSGLQIINISNKNSPEIIGNFYVPAYANYTNDATVVGNYVYVAERRGVKIIDINNKSEPELIGIFDSPGYAMNLAIMGDYIYVADGQAGLLKLRTNIGPSSKGNLILVAGGVADPENTLWPATQAQANHVFNTFINNGYEVYDIWYQNPVFLQDIDYDGIINQLVVDGSTPTKEKRLPYPDWTLRTGES